MENEPTPQPASPAEPAPDSVIVPPLAPQPVATSPLPVPPATPDRSTGLVIFGVIQIILGLMAALMVPLIALSAALSHLTPAGAMRPGQYVSGSATYLFLAVALIWLGVGSMRAKRWARALTLVSSWYWLILGVLVTILLTAALPLSMKEAMRMQQNAAGAPSQAISTGVMAVIVTIIIVFCAILLIVIPIAFVVFYSRADVAATCRYRDPVEPWTDRTPLPVLGASVVLFVGALYLLLTGVATPVFPFFGRYLTGVAAAACLFGLAALDIYVALAIFRLKPIGWWLAVLTVPVRFLSMALTYAKGDLMRAYSRMGMSDAQLQMMQSSPFFRSHVILWWSLLSLFIFFGYLLWLKRFFKTPPESSPAAAVTVQAG